MRGTFQRRKRNRSWCWRGLRGEIFWDVCASDASLTVYGIMWRVCQRARMCHRSAQNAWVDEDLNKNRDAFFVKNVVRSLLDTVRMRRGVRRA